MIVIEKDFRNAVKTDDGKLENFTLRIQGKSQRCSCGCNVFHKPDKTRPDIFRCNSCGETFETE
jgi:hypothetical protein